MRYAVLALALLGCNPKDVETEGSWVSWLATGSSSTILANELEGIEEYSRVYECTGRTYDPKKFRFDDNYVGPESAEDSLGDQYYGGGCYGAVDIVTDRDGAIQYEELDDGTLRARWAPRVVEGTGGDTTIPEEYYMPAYCGTPTDNGEDDAALNEVIQHEVDECAAFLEAQAWPIKLASDGYYSFGSDIDAWRSEAIITGEGDLQITLHQDLGGKDLHFSFTIMPDFEPVRCVSDETGGASIEQVDGASWLDQWSADEDGHTIYYLNAYGFQDLDPAPDSTVGPSNITDWSSGFGYANLEGEEFIVDSPTYGDFTTYLGADIDRDLVAEDPQPYAGVDAVIQNQYDQVIAATWDLARAEVHEAVEIAGAYSGDIAAPSWVYGVKVEDNKWRPLDGVLTGFDGWTEIHRSWVRIKDGSKIEPDGSVEGDFQMVLSGRQSGSQFAFRGTFKVERIREDKWAYNFLEDDLRNTEGWGEKFCE
jgi:hypothetical protein